MKLYQNDALEQYGRRESIRIHNAEGLGDDAAAIVIDVARQIELLTPADKFGNQLSIGLSKDDIHRCHFVGKKRIICRFNSSAWNKRTKIMLKKRFLLYTLNVNGFNNQDRSDISLYIVVRKNCRYTA